MYDQATEKLLIGILERSLPQSRTIHTGPKQVDDRAKWQGYIMPSSTLTASQTYAKAQVNTTVLFRVIEVLKTKATPSGEMNSILRKIVKELKATTDIPVSLSTLTVAFDTELIGNYVAEVTVEITHGVE